MGDSVESLREIWQYKVNLVIFFYDACHEVSQERVRLNLCCRSVSYCSIQDGYGLIYDWILWRSTIRRRCSAYILPAL